MTIVLRRRRTPSDTVSIREKNDVFVRFSEMSSTMSLELRKPPWVRNDTLRSRLFGFPNKLQKKLF